MQKPQLNYNNTYFYKLCCKDPAITDIYIGHTIDFITRKINHKYHCCNEKAKDYNTSKYQFLRDHGGWDNWDMELIETLKCDNALHAKKIERGHIEQLQASLNIIIPTRTREEHYQDNRDKLIDYGSLYYEKNTDKIKMYQKQYHELNKDKIKEQRIQFYQDNRGKLIV